MQIRRSTTELNPQAKFAPPVLAEDPERHFFLVRFESRFCGTNANQDCARSTSDKTGHPSTHSSDILILGPVEHALDGAGRADAVVEAALAGRIDRATDELTEANQQHVDFAPQLRAAYQSQEARYGDAHHTPTSAPTLEGPAESARALRSASLSSATDWQCDEHACQLQCR